MTGGFGADVVLQCAPSARADEMAIAMGGPGGRVVLVGAALEPFSVRAAEIFWRELAVLGSRGFVPDDIRDAIDLYLAGSVKRRPPPQRDPAARGGPGGARRPRRGHGPAFGPRPLRPVGRAGLRGRLAPLVSVA